MHDNVHILIELYVHICVFQVSADWERASLRPSSQPSSVYKPSPVMGTYTTEGGFINTNLVTTDEESQEFDDLIFALKTGEDPMKVQMHCTLTYPCCLCGVAQYISLLLYKIFLLLFYLKYA